MVIKNRANGYKEISTDQEHILHIIGNAEYPIVRTAIVADPSKWEEIPLADIPPYTEDEYDAKVDELIRQKYTASQEFALINNVLANVTPKRQAEYAEYQTYREWCKKQAKEILSKKVEE